MAEVALTGVGHSSTSVRAAQVVPAQKWRDRLLLEFFRCGYRGLTAAEAGQRVGLSTQLAGSRFLELRGERRKANQVPKPLIVRTDVKRGVSGGREGYVHVLTGYGWSEAQALKDKAHRA